MCSSLSFLRHCGVVPVWLLCFLLLCCPPVAVSYFADWSALTRENQPLCVHIPQNLTLCHDIGYTKMRLPNLLDHDTMQEVSNVQYTFSKIGMQLHCLWAFAFRIR